MISLKKIKFICRLLWKIKLSLYVVKFLKKIRKKGHYIFSETPTFRTKQGSIHITSFGLCWGEEEKKKMGAEEEQKQEKEQPRTNPITESQFLAWKGQKVSLSFPFYLSLSIFRILIVDFFFLIIYVD